jgi:hypothetical protein
MDAPDQAIAAVASSDDIGSIGTGVATLSDRITRRYFALLPAVQTVGWTSDDAGDLRGAA